MCMNIFHTQAANVGERFRQNLSSPDSLRSNFEMAGSVRAKLPGVWSNARCIARQEMALQLLGLASAYLFER